MHYKTGYCFNSKDLFETWDVKQLGISSNIYYKKYHIKCLSHFCAQIFLFFMYVVLLDIIHNNATFVLPLKGNRHAMIHVKVFDGDDFRKSYAGGKFLGIDFLSSNFKGYQIYFTYNTKSGEREKPIYIDKKMKEVFYNYINEGKSYY